MIEIEPELHWVKIVAIGLRIFRNKGVRRSVTISNCLQITELGFIQGNCVFNLIWISKSHSFVNMSNHWKNKDQHCLYTSCNQLNVS